MRNARCEDNALGMLNMFAVADGPCCWLWSPVSGLQSSVLVLLSLLIAYKNIYKMQIA